MAAADARRAAPWLRLAPVLLFLALAAWAWSASPGSATGGWLDRAREVSGEWAARGGNPLRALLAVEDPRVGPGLILLRAGLSPAALDAAMRLLGIALGAIAVGLLARRVRGVAPWLLAASPLWVDSCVRAEPAVLLGLAFFALAESIVPAWAAALVLGYALGWSPWAWVTLLAIPIGWLLRQGSRRAAGAVLAAAVVLVLLLDPPAALHPAKWASSIRWQGRIDGLASAFSPFGTVRGAWPAIGALHLPALLLLAAAALAWPRRARGGDFAPVGFVAGLVLALPSGWSRPAPLLVLLPWAAAETGRGLAWLAPHLGAVRSVAVRALPVVLVAPLLALGAVRATRLGARQLDPRPPARAWIETNVAAKSLLAYDPGFAPADSSRMVWLPLPYHSTDANRYRAAYWPGWYGAFRGFLVSEALMTRYLRDPEAAGEALAFHLRVMRAAATDQAFGQTAGRRWHVLLLPPSPNALAPGWKERVRVGEAGGLPGAFVAGLGGALIEAGRVGDGTDLLSEALAAGYRDQGIYGNLASGRLAAGRAAEAGQTLEEALQRYPDDPELMYNFALVLLRLEYWDRAIGVLGRLRTIWPRSPDAAYLLGLALVHTPHANAAPRALQDALDLGLGGPRREAALAELARLRGAAP